MAVSKWSVGAKIWFGFMILAQWLMFIEYATKPITQYSGAYQEATGIYFFVGLVGTALYLWLSIGKKQAALNTLVVVAVVNALFSLFQGGFGSMFTSLICPAITWLIAKDKVE